MTGPIEKKLRQVRDSGRKALVPYITGGYGDEWLNAIAAAVDAGADVLEIGLPFSDPVMDGPTIQEASEQALQAGATPTSIMDEIRGFDTEIPLVAMTYYNIAFRMGHERFAQSLIESGIGGVILPDLPLEETGPWREAADAAGIETVLLAAPTGSDERLERVASHAKGFVYGVGLLGITGERAALAASAMSIAKRLKSVTDMPVLVGVGVSTPEQAVEVCAEADGVIVGSAIVRRLLEGEGAEGVGRLVGEFRAAIDEAYPGDSA